MPITDDELQKVAVGPKARLNEWRWGAHLVTISGEAIDDLFHRTLAGRVELAETLATQGHSMLQLQTPQFRIAIGRFYYSMYHAMRAVVGHAHNGDDHEAHSSVPKQIPADFPNVALWKNDLKNARFARNTADYDVFPALDADYRTAAFEVRDLCDQLLPLIRPYLRQKGCKFI